MTHDFGLSDQSVSILEDILSSNSSVDEAIIYGSRAMGTYREGSDIDITLKGENLSFADLLKIQTALDDSYLPYYVDVSIFNRLENESLIDHINRVGKVFYKRS
ncbi:nucleotidyltransferase domain-containing protein [bacterium]|nr:MAG: nucleotidyltransferase domain-containing protein [bacterium]